jgi:4-amino-4-deoxy-L-arabinose transferase-like glycosyltransferase
MKFLHSNRVQIVLVLLLAGAWKIGFLVWNVFPFNSDEAVVGLMARHIQNGAHPVFFYGQAYMGSLDAFLVALFFWVFGEQVWCIRLVQCLLFLGTVGTTVCIGKAALGSTRAGIIAALLVAVPTVNGMLYTTASLGGYGEALLLGNLILLSALSAARRLALASSASGVQKFPWSWFGLWGFGVGLGLWANGLTLVYSAPAGLYLLWALWKGPKKWLGSFVLAAGLGFVLGSLPWWIYALTQGFDRLLLELLGTAVAVEKETWLARTGNHLVNFLLLGISVTFGFRPPWSVDWLGIPLIPFVLVFWIAVIVYLVRQLRKNAPLRSSFMLLSGVMLTLIAGFLFTAFGVDPSGRYFLPLSVPLALVAAAMILSISHRPWQLPLLVALIVGYQAIGSLQCAAQNPPGLTTQFYAPTRIDHQFDQQLMDFLLHEGETTGYSNYWVAYPLAFRSGEKLIFAPRLPYHLDLRYTPRDDRYAPYLEQVERSHKTAYITTLNPTLDQYIRTSFRDLGITWQEKQIGDYQIYYHLSRAVRPNEIGLGELTQ